MDAKCSLREAVMAANGSAPNTDCGQSMPPYTIQLAAATYTLAGSPAGEDNNAGGDLDIDAAMTIVGAGSGATTITIDNPIDRIINVSNPIAAATISNLKIFGGRSPDGVSGFATTNAGGDGRAGGGIFNSGTLTLDGVVVDGNSTGDGGQGGTSAGGQGQSGGEGGDGAGIASSGTLTVRGSTISGNDAGLGGPGGSPSGTGFGGIGGQGGSGAGIACYATCGPISVENSTITGNRAGTGGDGGGAAIGQHPGLGGSGGAGGAMSAFGQLTIQNSAIIDNLAGNGGAGGAGGSDNANAGFGGSGGGIISGFEPLTIVDSVISGNKAGNSGTPSASGGHGTDGGVGGGIYHTPQDTTITRTTISGNSAGDGSPGRAAGTQGGQGGAGGGIFFSAILSGVAYHILIADSAITGNSAGRGGDSDTQPDRGGDGGGIFTQSNKGQEIRNTTIANNAAGAGGSASASASGAPGGRGGGMFVDGSPAIALLHDTIAGNHGGAGGTGLVATGANGTGGALFVNGNTTTLRNSIVASNTAPGCAKAGAGAFTDGGYDISFADTTCPGANSDPLLQALASNGGPTKTMALAQGSPAIDIVPSSGAGCPPGDQRGITRPQGTACDAGAFEREVPPPATDAGGGGAGTPLPGGSSAAGVTPDKTAPIVKLLLFRQKLLKALRQGYVARFRTNEPGSGVAELFARRKGAGFAKLVRVARGGVTITKAGTLRLNAKFTKKAKRLLKRRRKVRLALRLTVKDAAGNVTRKQETVVLKR